MEGYFEEMMVWALGEAWKELNPKKANILFKERHPNFQDLKSIEGASSTFNSCYFITQIYNHWKQNMESKYEDSKAESQSEPECQKDVLQEEEVVVHPDCAIRSCFNCLSMFVQRLFRCAECRRRQHHRRDNRGCDREGNGDQDRLHPEQSREIRE